MIDPWGALAVSGRQTRGARQDGAVLMGEADRHAKRVRQLISAHLAENDTLGVEMGIGVLRGAAGFRPEGDEDEICGAVGHIIADFA